MHAEWFKDALTSKIIGDEISFSWLKSNLCIFFSILTFDFPLFRGLMEGGVTKSTKSEPGCRKSLLTLLPGAFPPASLRVEWLVVLWWVATAAHRRLNTFHSRLAVMQLLWCGKLTASLKWMNFRSLLMPWLGKNSALERLFKMHLLPSMIFKLPWELLIILESVGEKNLSNRSCDMLWVLGHGPEVLTVLSGLLMENC